MVRLMDDVRVYRGALSAARVLEEYTASVRPALVWQTGMTAATGVFWEGNGTVVNITVTRSGANATQSGYVRLEPGISCSPADAVTLVRAAGPASTLPAVSLAPFPVIESPTDFADGTLFAVTDSAISDDGLTMLIADYTVSANTGAVWAYSLVGGSWVKHPTPFVPSNQMSPPWFGIGSTISGDGLTVAICGFRDYNPVGGTNSGATWIWSRPSTSSMTWTQEADRLIGSNPNSDGYPYQGARGAALNYNGDVLAVTGIFENDRRGAVWVFKRTSGTWSEQGRLTSSASIPYSKAATSVTINAAGTYVVAGGDDPDNSGFINEWTFTAGSWVQVNTPQFKLVDFNFADAYFGCSVSLSGDDRVMAVGAYGGAVAIGAVILFTRAAASGPWTRVQTVRPEVSGLSWFFGHTARLTSDASILAVGSYGASNNIGALDIYARSAEDGLWYQAMASHYPTNSTGIHAGVPRTLSRNGARIGYGITHDRVRGTMRMFNLSYVSPSNPADHTTTVPLGFVAQPSDGFPAPDAVCNITLTAISPDPRFNASKMGSSASSALFTVSPTLLSAAVFDTDTYTYLASAGPVAAKVLDGGADSLTIGILAGRLPLSASVIVSAGAGSLISATPAPTVAIQNVSGSYSADLRWTRALNMTNTAGAATLSVQFFDGAANRTTRWFSVPVPIAARTAAPTGAGCNSSLATLTSVTASWSPLVPAPLSYSLFSGPGPFSAASAPAYSGPLLTGAVTGLPVGSLASLTLCAVSSVGMSLCSAFTCQATMSSNSTLLNVTSPAGPLIPPFSPGVTSYTMSPFSQMTSSVTFAAVPADPTASFTVAPAALAPGVNVITITALAQDGVTKTTYTVTVTNPGPPIGPPAAPTFPTVRASAVTVAWVLPATVPAFPVTNCTLTRNDTVLIVTAGTSYVDATVVPLETYSYSLSNCSNSLGVSTGGPGPAAAVMTPYPAPAVTALLPSAAVVAPSATAPFSPTLTVVGTSFGLAAPHLLGVTVGGVNATSFAWRSLTLLTFVVPGTASLAPPYTLPVRVTVAVPPLGAATSPASVSLTVTVAIPPPAPITCAPLSSDPAGSLVISFNLTGQPPEITGVTVALGVTVRTAVRGAPESLTFAGLPAATAATFSVSSISSVPGRVPASQNVTCATAAVSGGATVFGPAPAVTSVSPASGPTTGGTLVTIRGANLGVTGTSQVLDILLDGVSCVFTKVWVSSSVVTCVSEPKAAPSGSPGPVTVKTFFGVSGAMTALFYYTAPGPVVADFNPRVVSPAGGSVVTLLGSNFGATAPSSIVATVSGAVCSPARWLSPSTIACTTPPSSASGYNASAPSEVILVVDGVQGRVTWSGPAPRFAYGTECVPACDWNVECVAGKCSSCRPGLTGPPACTTPVFAVTALDPLQTDEAGTRSVRVKVKVNLAPPPGKTVTVNAVLSDPAEAQVTPASLSFGAGAVSEGVFTVAGINDNRRDGNVTFGLSFDVAPDSPADHLAASYLLAPVIRITCNDSGPQILAIKPSTSPVLGANLSMTFADLDPAFEVWVGPSKARVIIGDGQARLSFATLQLQQSQQRYTVEVPLSREGYVPVTVVNYGGSMVTLPDELFITDACPQDGWYGKGAACRPCPKGAVCPGGQRMWPAEGYWNSGEDAGYVTPCDPPSACLGGKGRSCRVGHTGTFCGDCIKGYFNENGLCRRCPNKGSSIVNFVILTVTWIVFAVCVAAVKDQVTLSYIVIIFKSLQLLSTIGASSTGKLPRWVTGVYSILAVFGGNLDFLKIDCVSRRPFSVNFFCVLAYSVIIFLPIPLFLPLVKWGMVSRAVRQGARPKRLQRINEYFKDRLVRALTIWGSIVYQSVTALAMEALSCVPVRAGGGAAKKYVMVTVPNQVCYQGLHLLLCVVAVLLLLGLSVGFPALMLRKIMTNPDRRVSDKRFRERFSYFFEFYNVKHPWVWVFDFVAACVVASGKSFLRPHINYQMAVSVVVFGAKVLFIIVRRPYIDWLTDLIQCILAVVSLIAINMNFFERRNITKSTLLSSGLAGCMFAIFFGVIAVLIVVVVYLLVVKKTKEEDDEDQVTEGIMVASEADAHETSAGAVILTTTPAPDALIATEAEAEWWTGFKNMVTSLVWFGDQKETTMVEENKEKEVVFEGQM